MDRFPPPRANPLRGWIVGAVVVLVPLLLATMLSAYAIRRRNCSSWDRAVEAQIQRELDPLLRRNPRLKEEMRQALDRRVTLPGPNGEVLENPHCR